MKLRTTLICMLAILGHESLLLDLSKSNDGNDNLYDYAKWGSIGVVGGFFSLYSLFNKRYQEPVLLFALVWNIGEVIAPVVSYFIRRQARLIMVPELDFSSGVYSAFINSS